MHKKRILVAALNWGLGHAARCIPIITELEKNNFEVLIASDGAALELLQMEFPHLKSFELPSYNIEYSKYRSLFKWKLILDSPKILQAIKAEKKITTKLVEEYNLNGIISDNRLGVRYKYVKSVFITHQLNVLTGNTTFLSSKLHQLYIRKFDQCWIPDSPGRKNLSGILGHQKEFDSSQIYIGPISRFEKKKIPMIYDYLVLVSGPEPQRSLLENILLKEFQYTSKKVLFIRGVFEENTPTSLNPKLIIKNVLLGKELEDAFNSSKLFIGRSGYTTLMDLAKLEKKAFFIPTPGQFEQEYLAERLMKLGIAPYSKQENFKIEDLEKMQEYSGLTDLGFNVSFKDIFTFGSY